MLVKKIDYELEITYLNFKQEKVETSLTNLILRNDNYEKYIVQNQYINNINDMKEILLYIVHKNKIMVGKRKIRLKKIASIRANAKNIVL